MSLNTTPVLVTKKNKTIVFLVPPIDMGRIFGEFEDVGNVLPFVGLMTLASLCRERGYRTYLLDALALKLTHEETIERLKELEPDYIGINVITTTVADAAKMARFVRKELPPGTKVIVGGHHVTAVPEKTMKRYPEFDIGVLSEGEETLLEVLRVFDSGIDDFRNVAGVVYRDSNGVPVQTAQREFISDFDKYPLPAWDLLPPLDKHYRPAADSLSRLPAVNMMVSRGCPFKCNFCFNAVDPRNRKVRWLSMERITAEITMLVRDFGVREIHFFDDNMIAKRKRLSELCHWLIEQDYDLTWTCYGSAHYAEKDLFGLMARAGCWQISWGVEHGSQRILDVMAKHVTTERIKESLGMARAAGLKNRVFMMHGNFLETPETIEESIAFLKELPADDFHASFFTPLPGTPAYFEVDKYGKWLIDPDDWESWGGNLQAPIFLPNGLTVEDLVQTHKKMHREFYFRPRIVKYYMGKILRNPSVAKQMMQTGLGFLRAYIA